MAKNRYAIIASTERNMYFTLLFVSQLKYNSDWESLVHTHPFTEIFYVIKGKGSFITNQHQFDVQESDVVVVNSNVEHTEISSEESPLEYIAIGVQGISFANPSQHSEPFIFYNFHDKKKEVLHYLNAIVNEANEQLRDYENVCHNFLEILIIKLLRESELELEIDSQTNLSKGIAQAKHYIDNQFKDDITLDLLAKLTHLNKFYLSHSFKDEIGRTPIQYLNYRRIEESKFLLQSTNYSISQIANIVGYTSQSYFSEVFNKYESKTPSVFRKMNQ